MFDQKSAEAFVIAWETSETVEDVADSLGRPPVVVNRLARFLIDAGVRLKPLPQSARPDLN